MRTNRFMIFLIAFLWMWLGVVVAVWPVETRSVAPSKQVVTPPASGPTKTIPKATKELMPLIIIHSPGEGETWYGGQTRDIQWSTLAIPEGAKMKIEFIRSNTTKLLLADNLPRSGKFPWKITQQAFLEKEVPNPYGGLPSYFPIKTEGKLKLTTSHEGKNYEGERSISLVVPGLKITSPKQGDTWQVGKTYPVTWQNIGPALSTVTILIVTGSGIGTLPLFSTHVGNTGSASITVPTSSLVENNTNFRLRVQSSGTSFPEAYIYDRVPIKIMK